MGLRESVKHVAQSLILGGSLAYMGWLGFGKVENDRPQKVQKANEVIAHHPELELMLTDTSPSGKRLAFLGRERAKNTPYDTFVYHVDRQTLENITQSPLNEGYSRWIDEDTLQFKYLDSQHPDASWEYAWKNIRTGSSGSVPSTTFLARLRLASILGIPLLTLFGIAFMMRKRQQSLPSVLGENLNMTAGAACVSSAVTLGVFDNLLRFYQPDMAFEYRPSYLATATGVGLYYALATSSLANVKPPRIRNFVNKVKCYFQVSFGSYKTKMRAINQLKQIVTKPGIWDTTHAEIAFRYEKPEEGFLALKRGLASITDEVTALEYNLPFLRPTLKLTTALRRKNKATQLSKSLHMLIDLNFNAVLNEISEFVAEQPGPDREAARALFVQSIADAWPEFKRIAPTKIAKFEQQLEEQHFSLDQLAQDYWKSAIGSILEEPEHEKRFKRMGESRNEVLEYAANEFLKGLLVFKRCDQAEGKRLLYERENILALRERFGDEIVQSLAFLEHEGKTYHVLRHGTSRTLEDVLRSAPPEEQLSRLTAAADLLGRIHRVPPPVPSAYMADDYYSSRLVKVFYDQLQHTGASLPDGLHDELVKVGGRIASALQDAPIGWYKDANPRNWLVEDKNIVAIDFEHRTLAPVQLDLVSLLEFGSAPALPELRQAGMERYFSMYCQGRASDHDRFMHEYRFAALQRHLELIGYRVRDKEYQAATFHLRQAQAAALELGEERLAEFLTGVTIAGPSADH